jgi:hypothetical protein
MYLLLSREMLRDKCLLTTIILGKWLPLRKGSKIWRRSLLWKDVKCKSTLFISSSRFYVTCVLPVHFCKNKMWYYYGFRVVHFWVKYKANLNIYNTDDKIAILHSWKQLGFQFLLKWTLNTHPCLGPDI